MVPAQGAEIYFVRYIPMTPGVEVRSSHWTTVATMMVWATTLPGVMVTRSAVRSQRYRLNVCVRNLPCWPPAANAAAHDDATEY